MSIPFKAFLGQTTPIIQLHSIFFPFPSFIEILQNAVFLHTWQKNYNGKDWPLLILSENCGTTRTFTCCWMESINWWNHFEKMTVSIKKMNMHAYSSDLAIPLLSIHAHLKWDFNFFFFCLYGRHTGSGIEPRPLQRKFWILTTRLPGTPFHSFFLKCPKSINSSNLFKFKAGMWT